MKRHKTARLAGVPPVSREVSRARQPRSLVFLRLWNWCPANCPGGPPNIRQVSRQLSRQLSRCPGERVQLVSRASHRPPLRGAGQRDSTGGRDKIWIYKSVGPQLKCPALERVDE